MRWLELKNASDYDLEISQSLAADPRHREEEIQKTNSKNISNYTWMIIYERSCFIAFIKRVEETR